jgi:hypothetical protein
MAQGTPSNFPNGFRNGVVIKGLPLSVTNPGKVFWVNGSSALAPGGVGGSNSNDGTYQRPFATIDYAVGQCTANRGDIIMVMPGHSEDIGSAGALTLDVAGVAVIGLGSGSLRPDLNYSNTAGTVEIDAADVTLYNLTFTADVSAVVVGVNVDANGCTIDSCEFTYNASGDDFITGLDVDTVSDFTFTNNKWNAQEAAGAAEAIRLDTVTRCNISGNHFTGMFSDGAIIGEGAAGTGHLIADNYIYNADTAGGEGIDLNVACTGLIVNNRLGTLFTTAPETTFDPGSCLCLENYVANAINESGIIVPTTLST